MKENYENCCKPTLKLKTAKENGKFIVNHVVVKHENY